MIDSASPRASSTVILARESHHAPEVFVVQRHAKSSFGSMYAFPGGVLDADDFEVDSYCSGRSATQANATLGVESDGLAFYSAAIRELFEETGVLLADLASVDEDLVSVRDELNAGSRSWQDFVGRNDLMLQCDAMHYISHWITPQQQPKRYSTRFFVAALPDGQAAYHCGGELIDSRWDTASAISAAARSGEIDMIFPTIKTLESVARHQTLQELLEWAASCADWGVTSMMPVEIFRDGKREIVLPGDMHYPGTKS